MGKKNRRRNGRSDNRADARARMPSPERNKHNENEFPASCAEMYPPGCLHTLTEEERNSPEMNRCLLIMHQFALLARSYEGDDEFQVFWDRPENRVFINNNLLRVIFYNSIKLVREKDECGPNWSEITEGFTHSYFPGGP